MKTTITSILSFLIQKTLAQPVNTPESNQGEPLSDSLAREAHLYGRNSGVEEPLFMSSFNIYIHNLVARHSPKCEKEAFRFIKEEILPEWNDIQTTHGFDGWVIDEFLMEQSFNENKTQIHQALQKIFEFSKSESCNAWYSDYCPNKMNNWFNYFIKNSLFFNGQPVSFDTGLIYLSINCDMVVTCLRNEQTRLRSLFDKVTRAASLVLSDLDNMDELTNPRITSKIPCYEIQQPEADGQTTATKIVDEDDEVENDLDALVSSFIDEYKLEYQQIQNDWKEITSSSIFSDYAIKNLIEGMRLRSTVLLNLKNAMMLFYNAPKIFRNEEKLMTYELIFKNSDQEEDEDEDMKNQNAEENDSTNVFHREADLEMLLFNQLLSSFSYETIVFQ